MQPNHNNNQHNDISYREPVRLPQMPVEDDNYRALPNMDMPKGVINASGDLVFRSNDGFLEALRLGFFLLKVPDEVDLSSGDRFVRNFYTPKSTADYLRDYTGYKDVNLPETYQGYFDRPYDQWENFYIASNHWSTYFSKQLQHQADQTVALGVSVLRSVLDFLHIPRNLWSTLSSGLTEKSGHHMYAFNHFRADKPVRGSKFHRDSGWVTVLRSTEPGMVALVGDTLYTVNPEPGYFIVNFGSSIEVLTAKLATPARGNIHGVVRTMRTAATEDRVSYAMFLDSSLSGDIYQLDDPATPRRIQTVLAFAEQEVSRTYDNNDMYL